MAELVSALNNLSLQNEICSCCDYVFTNTAITRYCAACSSLSYTQPLCDHCSQVFSELDTTICYFHMSTMLSENSIMYCIGCSDIIVAPCEHNHTNYSSALAKKYLREKYPKIFW